MTRTVERSYKGRREGVQGGLEVVSGLAVPTLSRKLITDYSGQIYDALGQGKAMGFMHQPPLDTVFEGMENGRYALLRSGDDLLATAHFRVARSGRHEVGGVFKFNGPSSNGRLAVIEGRDLGLGDGAQTVEALVANHNERAQSFFRDKARLPGVEETGSRDSDYVKFPEGHEREGKAVPMTIFDVTHARLAA